jgi:hypothetical protein
MTMRWHCGVVLVTVFCLSPAVQLLHADEILLQHDDDLADGKRSYGGSGHVVEFQAPPEGDWYVDRIDLCASQYGAGYDPANTFVRAYVCDLGMNVIAEAQAPYQLFPRAQNQEWGSIDVPSALVKGGFYVVVAPGSQQFRGLYVAFDSTGKTAANCHSGAGSPGSQPKPLDPPGDWMIRCHLTTDAAEAPAEEETGEVLSWDDGSAEDQQSFGGPTGMVVRFDPPAGEGVVDAIRLFASTYGTGEGSDRTGFTLAICDPDMNVLSNNLYPYALLTSDPHWVRVDLLPDVPVTGPFYVVYVGHCLQTDGIYLGIDTSRGSGQSALGVPGELQDWGGFRLPQNQVNWMIRAELKKP